MPLQKGLNIFSRKDAVNVEKLDEIIILNLEMSLTNLLLFKLIGIIIKINELK